MSAENWVKYIVDESNALGRDIFVCIESSDKLLMLPNERFTDDDMSMMTATRNTDFIALEQQ